MAGGSFKTVFKAKGGKRHKKRKARVGTKVSHRGYMNTKIGGMFNGWAGHMPMPPHITVKMRYSQTFTMAVGAAGVFGTQQKFNLNSVFDCDATGGGHQPSGFDQMASFYNRYKVLSAKIHLHATDPSIDGLRMIYVILNPSNTAESLTGDSRDVVAELQQSGWFDMNNSGKQTYDKRASLPIWKVSGLTKLQFDADPDNFTAPVTGDPGSLVQFAWAMCDLNQNGAGACIVTFTVDYKVQFYARKFLPQS